MSVSNQWDGRKIMQLTQAARFMTAALKMVTASLVQHEENLRLKQDDKLRDAILQGEKPDIKKIEQLMNRSCIRFDDDGIHFDDHVNVRLLKNYTPAEFSVAMAEHNVGSIRIVDCKDGLTAILYSSLDEDKMTAALKSMEMALGASPVVTSEVLQKMCDARGSSKIYEFTDLSYADAKRFELAASKNSMNIAIEKNNDKLKTATYKVRVLSSDKSKIEKAMRDVAIYKTKDGADATDRHYTMMEKTAEKAAEKVVGDEVFYVCSPSRPNSYIEVTPKGYRVMSQDIGITKVAKEVEGKISDPQKFTELCEEMSSFENPTILSKDEFKENPDERLIAVVSELTTLEQKNEGKAYVADLTLNVLSAANACDRQIKSSSEITSEALWSKISNSNIPGKETAMLSIEHLRNLPKEMINEVFSEYKDYESSISASIEEAERDYAPATERDIETRENELDNAEEKE